jgi:hypothetical protein
MFVVVKKFALIMRLGGPFDSSKSGVELRRDEERGDVEAPIVDKIDGVIDKIMPEGASLNAHRKQLPRAADYALRRKPKCPNNDTNDTLRKRLGRPEWRSRRRR